MNSKIMLTLFATAVSLFAQSENPNLHDKATTLVGRASLFENNNLGSLPHVYHLVQRRPRPGCDRTEVCGTVISDQWTHNLRTSAGTTWQSELMGKTTTPTTNLQCNYLGLTNTAVTPAEADTTLSGEISTNGLGRAQAAYADASGALTVPAAPTLAVTGGGGGTAQFYFVVATNQGVDTTPSVASSSATPNATLDSTHYITASWTPVNGAAGYKVIRSNSSSAPSGSLAGGANQSSTGLVSSQTAAACTSTTCTLVDSSNTLTAYTVPASNLTNFGKYTLIKTWTATGAQSAQAFGAFTAVSSGVMCFEGTFAQVSLNINDTFQLTESVYFKRFLGR